MDNETQMTTCDGCGETVKSESINHPFTDCGWNLNLAKMDYYGGFTDVDWTIDATDNHSFRLCHDCCVKLLGLFPLIAKRVPRGSHPCESDVPCCDYAWTLDDFGVVMLANNGKWEYDKGRYN